VSRRRGRRVKSPRKLRRAIWDYLERGEEATEAVAIITRVAAARASSRRAWADRPREVKP